MAKRAGPKAECAICERTFRKCRRNVHRQEACGREACKVELKRRRQRRWYRNKYREDKAFQESERKRCGKSLKARRKKKPAVEGELNAEAKPDLELVILGVMETLLEAPDAQSAWECVRRCERRGHKLAIARPLVRGAPRG